MRHRAHVPDIRKNLARAWLKHLRQLAVMRPCARDGSFVDCALRRSEMCARWRNIRLRAVEPHIPLALLLGIVERMRVQKRPHELPAHVFESELEMRVLVNRMMPAVIRAGADRHAL